MEYKDEMLVEIWCPLADLDPDDFEEFFNGVWTYLDAQEHGLAPECFDDSETIGDHEVFAVWRARSTSCWRLPVGWPPCPLFQPVATRWLPRWRNN